LEKERNQLSVCFFLNDSDYCGNTSYGMFSLIPAGMYVREKTSIV